MVGNSSPTGVVTSLLPRFGHPLGGDRDGRLSVISSLYRVHTPGRAVSQLRPRSVRLRLTLLYGGLFLLSGAALLAITYLLVRHATGHGVTVKSRSILPSTPASPRHITSPELGRLRAEGAQALRQAGVAAARQHASELRQLLLQSGVALAIMSVVSVALGWLVAGRVLRPLRTITATAQRISQDNLHERLALAWPGRRVEGARRHD